MAKKPDTPCAGCGKLLWGGSTSLPAGTRTCRTCRAAARPAVQPRRPSVRTSAHDRRENLRAYWRRKNHRRRAVARWTDLSAEAERALRAKATRCPLCAVMMTDVPQQPDSKELDHIVPIGVGGTHTLGNVRIICRSCNLRRPRDGSDYLGQVTLWAQDQGTVAALLGRERTSARKCAGCGQPGPKGRERCYACLPKKKLPRQEDGRRAAELRADGAKWQDIADALGFTNTGAAYICAEKWGEPEVVARWPGRYVHGRA